jgi:hypothetical protein
MGWQPDPSWGLPPPGWTFWRTDDVVSEEPLAGATVLGHRADRQYGKVLAQLGSHLEPGEVLTALFVANTLKTLVNGIAVTNRRVLGWNGTDLARKPPRIALPGSEIESFDFERSTVNRLPRLMVTIRGAEPVLVGQLLSKEDENLLGEAIRQLVRRSAPAAPVPTVAEPPAPIPVVPPRQRPEPLRTPNPTSSPVPPVVPAASSGERHAQLARLLDEGVIDEEQAVYLRSVLFG